MPAYRQPARLVRLSAPLMIAGGLLWIATFVLIVVNGLMTGTLPNIPDAASPLFLRIGIRAFTIATLLLDGALIGVYLRLRRHARVLPIVGLGAIVIALGMAATNLATLSGLLGTARYSDTFGGLSVMLTSIGTLVFAIAGLRTAQLSRAVAYLLIFVGLTTIPILFTTPFPIGPDYATDFLAFLTSGAAYVGAGILLRSAHASSAPAGVAPLQAA